MSVLFVPPGEAQRNEGQALLKERDLLTFFYQKKFQALIVVISNGEGTFLLMVKKL
jgi:hypothetical protein